MKFFIFKVLFVWNKTRLKNNTFYTSAYKGQHLTISIETCEQDIIIYFWQIILDSFWSVVCGLSYCNRWKLIRTSSPKKLTKNLQQWKQWLYQFYWHWPAPMLVPKAYVSHIFNYYFSSFFVNITLLKYFIFAF